MGPRSPPVSRPALRGVYTQGHKHTPTPNTTPTHNRPRINKNMPAHPACLSSSMPPASSQEGDVANSNSVGICKQRPTKSERRSGRVLAVESLSSQTMYAYETLTL